MKFFSGIKARKLAKAIENYPDVFKNYQDIVTLHLADGDIEEARQYLVVAQKRTWDEPETAWLTVQSLKIQSILKENPHRIVTTAITLLQNQQIPAETKLDAADTAIRLVSECHIQVNPEDLETLHAVCYGFRDSLGEHVDLVHLFELLSEMELSAGRTSDAFHSIETALKIAGNQRRKTTGKLWLRGARIARSATIPVETVRKWFTRALESGDLDTDETIETLIELARMHLEESDLLGAMERFETVLRFAGEKRDPVIADVRIQLARVYYQLGRVPQAEKEVDLALAGNTLQGEKLAEIYLWLAEIKEAQNQADTASKHLAGALKHAESDQTKARILERQAILFETREAFEDAIKALEQAIDLNEDLPDHGLLLFQARLFNRTNAFHKSIKILRQLLMDHSPESGVSRAAILFETARAYMGQFKTIRALETLMDVFSATDRNTPVWLQAQKLAAGLRKELNTPDGIKKYRIDGSDRKILSALLVKIPDQDDFLTRLKSGLKKTRSGLIVGIERILQRHSTIDEDVLDEIEELMILSDLGVETTGLIIDGLREKLARKELHDASVVRNHIRGEIERILAGHSARLKPDSSIRPYIIMAVGVNGVGKTTTIAKIARRFQEEGHSVLLAAADTFRAGAIEQLREWGRRLDVAIIAHDEGADPSAVAWDAVAAAKNRDIDVLIIDTAGRLHTKSNLMEELKKVQRVIDKNMPGAPHDILLVLDATTGQNAVIQAREFSQTVNVSGIALTKLDGTAKGGIIVSIVQELDIPIKLIGIGERMDDLRDFDAGLFAKALFDESGDDQVGETTGMDS